MVTRKTGTFHEPSTALAAEKQNFGSSRSASLVQLIDL
jgi:hypothetical protein